MQKREFSSWMLKSFQLVLCFFRERKSWLIKSWGSNGSIRGFRILIANSQVIRKMSGFLSNHWIHYFLPRVNHVFFLDHVYLDVLKGGRKLHVTWSQTSGKPTRDKFLDLVVHPLGHLLLVGCDWAWPRWWWANERPWVRTDSPDPSLHGRFPHLGWWYNLFQEYDKSLAVARFHDPWVPITKRLTIPKPKTLRVIYIYNYTVWMSHVLQRKKHSF